MPRIPSLRRPVIETMKSESERIRKRQDRAQKRLTRGYEQWGNDPDKAEAVKALEEDAALTEREVATLEAAAKVAALLERVPEKDEEDEKPLTPEAQRAAMERLEARGPVPQRREEAE